VIEGNIVSDPPPSDQVSEIHDVVTMHSRLSVY
jgi:hypothetical protein